MVDFHELFRWQKSLSMLSTTCYQTMKLEAMSKHGDEEDRSQTQ